MIPDILIILFTILNSIKIKGYHQFERKIDKWRMQVSLFKTNSKAHHRITRLRINTRLRVCLFKNQINAIFVKTMTCLSRTCLSRTCLSRPCWSRPCHVCQYYLIFVMTMSCLTRTCHSFQDHVMFVMTMFFKTNLVHFYPIWSCLIPYDPTWYVYILSYV